MSASVSAPQYLDRPNAPSLAWRLQRGRADAPCFIWLGGYASDMLGSKAEAISQWAQAQNISFLRFDYSGHGESEGDFEQGCISSWRDDTLDIIKAVTSGPLVLIGSSMGAWIACHVIKAMTDRISGFVAIAPAPDFVTELVWPNFSPIQQQQIMQDGKIGIPSDYDNSEVIYTRLLIEDGRACCVLDKDLTLNGPVHILHGTKDISVPWDHAKLLADHICAPEVTLTLVKDGDHRLSTSSDLARLCRTLDLFVAT